jgi:hypothetical protein
VFASKEEDSREDRGFSFFAKISRIFIEMKGENYASSMQAIKKRIEYDFHRGVELL